MRGVAQAGGAHGAREGQAGGQDGAGARGWACRGRAWALVLARVLAQRAGARCSLLQPAGSQALLGALHHRPRAQLKERCTLKLDEIHNAYKNVRTRAHCLHAPALARRLPRAAAAHCLARAHARSLRPARPMRTQAKRKSSELTSMVLALQDEVREAASKYEQKAK